MGLKSKESNINTTEKSITNPGRDRKVAQRPSSKLSLALHIDSAVNILKLAKRNTPSIVLIWFTGALLPLANIHVIGWFFFDRLVIIFLLTVIFPTRLDTTNFGISKNETLSVTAFVELRPVSLSVCFVFHNFFVLLYFREAKTFEAATYRESINSVTFLLRVL